MGLENPDSPAVWVRPVRSGTGILIQVCNVRIEELGEVTGQRVPGFFVFGCRFTVLWSFAHARSVVLPSPGGKACWRLVTAAGKVGSW